MRRYLLMAITLAAALALASLAAAEPLPSWNEGPAKSVIVRCTSAGGTSPASATPTATCR